ncbi:MAG: hypothetical protein WAV72_10590 [Bradyrhizobium sp.]
MLSRPARGVELNTHPQPVPCPIDPGDQAPLCCLAALLNAPSIFDLSGQLLVKTAPFAVSFQDQARQLA